MQVKIGNVVQCEDGFFLVTGILSTAEGTSYQVEGVDELVKPDSVLGVYRQATARKKKRGGGRKKKAAKTGGRKKTTATKKKPAAKKKRAAKKKDDDIDAELGI